MEKIIFLIRKYFFIILKIFLSVFFIPIIILIRIISPLKIIRFGKIRSGEYGHFIGATYVYLLIQDKKKSKYIDFFFFNNFVSNKHWAKLLKKKIKIYKIIELFYIANFFIPGYREHIYNIEDSNQGNEKFFDKYLTETIGKNKKKSIDLVLENKNKTEIESFLKKNNITKNTKFVIISSRDSIYKKTINLKGKLGIDFSYHDYMNWNVNNFIPTINYLNKLGYLVIRMGKYVEKKIKYKNKLFIDYANSKSRTDFLDLWLKKNCEFAVCSPSGFSMPLYIFKKPTIFVNCVPFSTIFSFQKNMYFLPKKLKFKGSKKFLSLINQKNNDFISLKRTDDYKKNNLLVLENTKKEIKDTVIDFLNKENKKFVSKKKEKLEKNFILLVKKITNKKIIANVSTSFLLNNKWFLKKN